VARFPLMQVSLEFASQDLYPSPLQGAYAIVLTERGRLLICYRM
jgi:hypothetical protein